MNYTYCKVCGLRTHNGDEVHGECEIGTHTKMSEIEWSDLLYDLTHDQLGTTRLTREKLAAHMSKLETDLENLKRRVAGLEEETHTHYPDVEQEILYGTSGASEPTGTLHAPTKKKWDNLK